MLLKIDKNEKYYLHNNNILETNNEEAYAPEENKIFYEVIRVIKGKPLFLDAHLERLKKSTLLIGINCIDISLIKTNIEILLKVNYVEEKNLKITFYCNEKENNKPELFAYFIESHYPSDLAYEVGVKVELLPLKRNNPNVKLENPILRGSADEVICLSQTHEALLVNDQGYITEGSRSNFFAVYGHNIVTPPANEVLEGVTRKVIIQIAQNNSIECTERPIHISEIEKMEGSFITGTSSKVLPIIKIGDHAFSSIPSITRKIMELYDRMVETSIESGAN